MSERKLMLRPGTVILILVIAVVGIAMFNWASDLTDNVEENSGERRDQAVKCSSLEINFVGRNSNATHTNVLLQTSQDVSALAVTFEGSEPYTDVIEDIKASDIRRSKAPVKSVEGVKAAAEGCERVFRAE